MQKDRRQPVLFCNQESILETAIRPITVLNPMIEGISVSKEREFLVTRV
jgi:hypothetical protein